MADEPKIEPKPLETPPSAPDGAASAAAAAQPPPPSPPPQDDSWKDARIDKITAQKAELKKQVEELEAKLKSAAPSLPQVDRDQITAQVREEERQRLVAEQFNARCNEVAQAGRQAFPDFDAKVTALARLVDRSDPASVFAYNNLISATLESTDPAKTFYEIASDLNEASKLLTLSPVRLGMEVARRGGAKPDSLSRAPAPIKDISGRTTSQEIDPADPERSDNLSTRAWMERRNKQLAQAASR